MPFFVYRIDSSPSRFRRTRKVSLAGRRGPFFRHVESAWTAQGKPDILEWVMSESDILSDLGFQPAQHALVIDLKPKVEGNVSLYRLRRVWGRSEPGWTPLALQLETLFVDRDEPDPDRFKDEFRPPPEKGDLVHEFLYLKSGTDFRDWGWGPIGSVNGTLLWPDTWRHFVTRINDAMQY